MLRTCISRNWRYRAFSSSNSKWLFDARCGASKGDLRFGVSVDKMGHLSESSVIASYGGSIVHVAVNSQASTEAGEDFLPLTVDYRARMSAFGLLPEGSRRREKSPGSDEEILVARFIDRAVRPLFPSGYVDEVQVTITNHATDGVNDPTVLALNATSMALLKSNQPWFGPIGCVRVGLVENKLVVNPSVQSLKESPFDLLYAGTIDRTLMIEAVGSQVSESLVKEAIDLAHAEVREIIGVQKQLLENLKNDECKIEKIVKKTGYFVKEEYRDMVRNLFGEKTRAFYHAPHEGKEDRSKAEGILRSTILENVGTHPIISTEKPIVQAMLTDELITKSFRQALLENPPCRTDGRGANEVRKIDCATGVLPSVHGSAYFARGDTHVLSTVTVGNMKDARETVALDGSNNEKVDYFYLHYDFPPYCNGEVGALTLNRRMIGHGNLAERALRSVIPSFENFPYTVRIMAECTSSNGSSSMASACSGTLALLEAGVPIQAPVAGISIGLVTEPAFAAEMKEFASGEAPANGNYRILTDILGSEDHHGDMDFKIAGTTTGITAIQLDVKLPGGIPLNIIKEALDAGKTARLQILKTMEPYTSPGALKPNAPRAALIPIDINRIGHLLANNGEVLKYLIKTYDVDVKIIEDDKAYIFGKNGALFKEAASLLYDVATAMKEGDVVEGAVIDVKDFGLFVRVNQGQEALLHISQISHDARINKVPLEELFRKGQRLNVKIMTVDNVSGLVQLSRKALYDANEVDKLFGPDSNNATIEPSVDKLSEQFGSLTAAFPVTPGRKWSPDYFRNSVVPETEIKKTTTPSNEPKNSSSKLNDNNSKKRQDNFDNGGKKNFSSNGTQKMNSNDHKRNQKANQGNQKANQGNQKANEGNQKANVGNQKKNKKSGDSKSLKNPDGKQRSNDKSVKESTISPPSIDDQYTTLSSEIADAVKTTEN